MLLLTGTTAKPDDIHLCHRLKNTEKAIAKFKDRKQRNDVIFKRKGLKSKAARAKAIIIWTVAVYDSVYFENQVLFYKCCKSKNLGR